MSSMIFLAAVAVAAEPALPAPAPVAGPLGGVQIHAPDEIVPAVLPYLSCLYASHGLALLNGTDREAINSKVGLGSDCSAVRHKAERDAIAVLKAKEGLGSESPEGVVATTLSSMDDYVAALAAQRTAATWGNLPAVSGSMVMMEDEVLPAFQKYNECLRSKAVETPITSANVLDKFQRAIPACGAAKASAVKEATDALAVKGWDADRRQKTAVTTFRKADESWASLGRRLYQALLHREGVRSPSKAGRRSHKS